MQYRTYLTQRRRQHPELFPQGMAHGYTFHDRYCSRKQGVVLRRIQLKAPAEVFPLRPAFLLPYCIARTEEVEKALSLRQWGVPFSAVASVFGRNAMFWYRAWLSLGRPNLVGTPSKAADQMPPNLVADEKIPWLAGEEGVVPPPVGGGGVLGIRVAEQGTSASLQAAYGEFKTAAPAIFPAYTPPSVCTDGFAATRDAWRQLLPHLPVSLCDLHAILNLTDRGRGALRRQGLDRAGTVYHAVTKAQFAQRLRRLAEWARTTLDGSLAQPIAKLAAHRDDFTLAYDCPQAARTTTAVERVHNHLDRVLYTMHSCHGQQASARLAVRAWALQWNFPPYGPRLRSAQPSRSSPFTDLNGFQYQANWLHNFLIASSLGGLRL